MARNNGTIERRLSFLEKAYLEDRRRWERNDRIVQGMLQVLRRQGDRLDEQGRRLKEQGERLDIVVRLLRRKFEE